jgi:hypothetical protein
VNFLAAPILAAPILAGHPSRPSFALEAGGSSALSAWELEEVGPDFGQADWWVHGSTTYLLAWNMPARASWRTTQCSRTHASLHFPSTPKVSGPAAPKANCPWSGVGWGGGLVAPPQGTTPQWASAASTWAVVPATATEAVRAEANCAFQATKAADARHNTYHLRKGDGLVGSLVGGLGGGIGGGIVVGAAVGASVGAAAVGWGHRWPMGDAVGRHGGASIGIARWELRWGVRGAKGADLAPYI